MAPFAYRRVRTFAEAITALEEDPDAKVLAGGQSLVPGLKLGALHPSVVVDIGRITGHDQIERTGDHLRIGALVRHHEVATDVLVGATAPALAMAARSVGDLPVRHLGTLGGTVALAHPAADIPTMLLALGATIQCQGPGGSTRVVAAEDFFLGAFRTALGPAELVTAVQVPITGPRSATYLKYHRRAMDWALVSVAVAETPDGWHVALANAGDGILRATAVEAALRAGEAPASAAAKVGEDIDPRTDAWGTAAYRRRLTPVLVRRALEQVGAP